MLTFPELHGLIVHLPVLAVPVAAVLAFLRWRGRGGESLLAAERWAFIAAVAGAALAVGSGLIVWGGAKKTLRGHAVTLVTIHLYLGVALLVLLVAAAAARWFTRGRRARLEPVLAGVGAVAVCLVLVIGYVGGRMVYIHGVGLHAGGELAQSASGAEQLSAGFARGTSMVSLGRTAFRTGLGCASCHGMQAQGKRGPCLSGGVSLGGFRRTHGTGLFPPAIVTRRMFEAVDDWLKTKPAGSACDRGGG